MKKEQADSMTVSELCNYSVQKIVEQGGRCIDGAGCAYGNKKNTKHCGIGWLLDENKPHLMDFLYPLSILVQKYSDELPIALLAFTKIFKYLQFFHDDRYQYDREIELNRFLLEAKNAGVTVDVSGPWWEKWIKMGEPKCPN
jgi:hypothetical protein